MQSDPDRKAVMRLTQKRIVLIGGSGGLGQLVAAEFLREGAELTIMSRRGTGNARAHARHVTVDLSSPAGIAEASAVVAREEPDILVNMAGVQYFGPAEGQPPERLYADYMVNLVAPVSLCGACLSFMKRRDSGQIANIGSVFGSIPLAHFAAYSSAKAGLRAYSEALRRELAGTKIAVTYVAPRAVRTGMLTPQIQRYAEATGMNVDPPLAVSERIVRAISQRKKEIYIGFPERIFVRLNAVLPRLVDTAVASGDRKAKRLFAAQDFPTH
jgi:short-subunit dehydrogenase